jgi:hypothetical protein
MCLSIHATALGDVLLYDWKGNWDIYDSFKTRINIVVYKLIVDCILDT